MKNLKLHKESKLGHVDPKHGYNSSMDTSIIVHATT